MDLPLEKEARARLLELLETRKAACAWRCPNRACDGKPHDGYNYKHARGKQQPPWGQVITIPATKKKPERQVAVRRWYARGGRGSGKTWAGANALAEIILWYGGTDEAGEQRSYAVVGPNFSHVRRTCLESGKSGLIKALGGLKGPHILKWNRNDGELHLKNGAIVVVSGVEDGAKRIEGGNFCAVWCDEVGLWNLHRWKKAWQEAIQGAVRMSPSIFIFTGTPKQGHPFVKMLTSDPRTVEVVMPTSENEDNLDATYVEEIKDMFEGTQLYRQEYMGEILQDVAGALWNSAMIETTRHEFPPAVDEMLNIVVGWDPAVTSTDKSDEHGIIVAARLKGEPAHFVILDDRSGVYSPDGAVSMVLDAYETWSADSIVVEVNQGGDFAESLLKTRTPSRTIDIKKVRASRGKRVRAEPIAALSEQGRLHMVGYFVPLEEQMTTWTPDKPGSPDRLDAMVWAITALLEKSTNTGAYYYGRRNQRPSGGQ